MPARAIPLLALAAACSVSVAAPTFSPAEIGRILRLSPIPTPPANETNRVADDERAAVLGQRLFFDERLSPDGRFSCATCHDPGKAFSDGRTTGEGRVVLPRNVPSLLDVAHQRWLHWDGSADSLWAQALRPIENPDEIAGDRLSLARLVTTDPVLRADYEAIFGGLPDLSDEARFPARARPGPIAGPGASPEATAESRRMEEAWQAMATADRRIVDTIFANLGKTLEAYQRRLRSSESPFDRFVAALRSEDQAGRSALSPSAQRGLQLFIGPANCRLCHSGPLLSDGEFHSIGMPTAEGMLPKDPGRYEGLRIASIDPFRTGGEFSDDPEGPRATRAGSAARNPDSWGQFRTPALRNVARTAPYMHAGQVATLEQVVRFYSTHEGRVVAGHHRETILEPLGLDEGQIADLIAFLESLTGGDPDSRWLGPPVTAADRGG